MTEKSQYLKPLPDILPETAEFWLATVNHILMFQQCRTCGKRIYFPRMFCCHCLSKDLHWVASQGLGTVYSFTIIHQAANEAFTRDVPYVYAIIELDEGYRMISNIINISPDQVVIGMRVKVVFEDATDKISIPRFEPL